MRSSGPARHVADAGGLDDEHARLALGEAAYQSSTSGVTKPSAVARHGTIAGTQVRVSAVRGPSAIGWNRRRRPVRGGQLVLETLGRLPHGRDS
jgi:hypothetical protein